MRTIGYMTDFEIITKGSKKESRILRVPVQIYSRTKTGRSRYDEIKGSATRILVKDKNDVDEVVQQIINAVTSLLGSEKKKG